MLAIINAENKVVGIANLGIIKKPYFKLTEYSCDIGNLDVQAGDDFIDGTFLRNGKPVGNFVPSYELKDFINAVEQSSLDNAEMLLDIQFQNDIKDLGGNI